MGCEGRPGDRVLKDRKPAEGEQDGVWICPTERADNHSRIGTSSWVPADRATGQDQEEKVKGQSSVGCKVPNS